jgi:hypothetical protein
MFYNVQSLKNMNIFSFNKIFNSKGNEFIFTAFHLTLARTTVYKGLTTLNDHVPPKSFPSCWLYLRFGHFNVTCFVPIINRRDYSTYPFHWECRIVDLLQGQAQPLIPSTTKHLKHFNCFGSFLLSNIVSPVRKWKNRIFRCILLWRGWLHMPAFESFEQPYVYGQLFYAHSNIYNQLCCNSDSSTLINLKFFHSTSSFLIVSV